MHEHPRPKTAEALMRSRFAAVRDADAEWLLASWHPSTRPASLDLTGNATWRGLQIIDTFAGGPDDDTGIVGFPATSCPAAGSGVQQERSRFVREGSHRYYLGTVRLGDCELRHVFRSDHVARVVLRSASVRIADFVRWETAVIAPALIRISAILELRLEPSASTAGSE